MEGGVGRGNPPYIGYNCRYVPQDRVIGFRGSQSLSRVSFLPVLDSVPGVILR